jgi:hypothetical protein
MTKLVDLIITYPVAVFLISGVLIASVSTIIEENNRRKRKDN